MGEFVVVAGMSGAGRSTAAAAMEDLGWFVIDNLPPELITKVAELAGRPGASGGRTALVVGRGGTEHSRDVLEPLEALAAAGHRVRVLFLDAPDEVLVRRFEASRRRHPLAAQGMEQSVAEERRSLGDLRDRADVVLDTGDLNVNQLRARIIELFGVEEDSTGMQTSIVSFGFKRGIPLDPDLLFDCRFLPNPHWVDGLRERTGLDEPVRRYVLDRPETVEFLDKVEDLLTGLIPAYRREGKSYLTIAMGCTGGRHRSVALAEALAGRLGAHGISASVFHRDVGRREDAP